jgi:hypothetical protein
MTSPSTFTKVTWSICRLDLQMSGLFLYNSQSWICVSSEPRTNSLNEKSKF